MADTPRVIDEKETTFDITITNGAAKKLQGLMDRFQGDELKVVSLALELLTLMQNADMVQFRNKGETAFKGVKIPDTVSSEVK